MRIWVPFCVGHYMEDLVSARSKQIIDSKTKAISLNVVRSGVCWAVGFFTSKVHLGEKYHSL